MPRSFRLRVRLERTALTIVNAKLAPMRRLHGVSPRAIQDWATRFGWSASPWERDEMLGLLSAFGAACQAMSDQSRSAFDPETFDPERCRAHLEALRLYVLGHTGPDNGSDEPRAGS